MSERISGGKIEEKNNLRVGDYVMFEDGSEMVGVVTNAEDPENIVVAVGGMGDGKTVGIVKFNIKQLRKLEGKELERFRGPQIIN
jgi:ferredoxin-fold anticodon binding domain-containing protein